MKIETIGTISKLTKRVLRAFERDYNQVVVFEADDSPEAQTTAHELRSQNGFSCLKVIDIGHQMLIVNMDDIPYFSINGEAKR